MTTTEVYDRKNHYQIQFEKCIDTYVLSVLYCEEQTVEMSYYSKQNAGYEFSWKQQSVNRTEKHQEFCVLDYHVIQTFHSCRKIQHIKPLYVYTNQSINQSINQSKIL